MAKRKTAKSREAEPEKSRLAVTALTTNIKRWRHAAVDLDMTESELFDRVTEVLFSGFHARGMSDSTRALLLNGTPPPGQGTGATIDQAVPTVRIQTVQNRLNDIARRSHGPVDDALDGLVSE